MLKKFKAFLDSDPAQFADSVQRQAWRHCLQALLP
jgi:hypothetical protein